MSGPRAERATVPPLLGRDRELAAISHLVADARAGRGGIVAIEGPAGIGKTRLLDEACRDASETGLVVLRATGSALESELAFGVARGLFERTVTARPRSESRARAVLGLVDRPVDCDEGETLHTAVDALYRLTERLTNEHPTLIVVDDAQWADIGSLRFLHYLARRIDTLPAAIAIALQPGPDEDDRTLLLASIVELAGEPLAPGPLAEAEIATLARAWLAAPPDPAFVSACLLASDGNAFLANELLRTLRSDKIEPIAAAAAAIATVVPDTLRRQIGTRIAKLTPEARALARALAIFGPAELPIVAALAEIDVETARRAAETLERVSILAAGHPLRFTHPIYAAAVTATIPARTLADSHGRAARILAADGESSDLVAVHLLQSEPGGDAWSVETLSKAATAARTHGAPETAAAFLRRALAEPPEPCDRPRLLLDLGRAELLIGAAQSAAANLRKGLELEGDPSLRASLSADLSAALLQQGDYDGAVLVLRRERELVGAGDAAPVLERLLFSLSLFCPEARRRAVADLGRWRAEARAGRGQDPIIVVLAIASAIGAGLGASDWLPLLDSAFNAPELGSPNRSGHDSAYALDWALVALDWSDQLDEVDRRLDDAVTDCLGRGDTPRASHLLAYRARTSYRLGRLAEAEAHARAAVELTTETQKYPFALLDILIERDRLEEAEALLATIDSNGHPQHRAMVSLMHGRVDLAAGRAESALASLLAAGEILDALELRHANLAPWRELAAEAAYVVGDRPLAHRLATENVEISRRSQAASAIGRALVTLAKVGDPRHSEALLSEANRTLAESSAALDRASALVENGSALARSGRTEEARDYLRSGLDLAYRCGAARLAARARRELVAAGGRPRRNALSGINGLTPSERQVVVLAANGLTNREIAHQLYVTLKTVERHLSRSYRKLEVSGRHGLKAEIANGYFGIDGRPSASAAA